jgi:hypothetical protein
MSDDPGRSWLLPFESLKGYSLTGRAVGFPCAGRCRVRVQLPRSAHFNSRLRLDKSSRRVPGRSNCPTRSANQPRLEPDQVPRQDHTDPPESLDWAIFVDRHPSAQGRGDRNSGRATFLKLNPRAGGDVLVKFLIRHSRFARWVRVKWHNVLRSALDRDFPARAGHGTAAVIAAVISCPPRRWFAFPRLPVSHLFNRHWAAEMPLRRATAGGGLVE